jgi:hypothetical protein
MKVQTFMSVQNRIFIGVKQHNSTQRQLQFRVYLLLMYAFLCTSKLAISQTIVNVPPPSIPPTVDVMETPRPQGGFLNLRLWVESEHGVGEVKVRVDGREIFSEPQKLTAPTNSALKFRVPLEGVEDGKRRAVIDVFDGRTSYPLATRVITTEFLYTSPWRMFRKKVDGNPVISFVTFTQTPPAPDARKINASGLTSPAIDENGRIFFGANDYRHGGRTGTFLVAYDHALNFHWAVPVEGRIYATPIVYRDYVVVVTAEDERGQGGWLYIFWKSNGRPARPRIRVDYCYASPILFGDAIYMVTEERNESAYLRRFSLKNFQITPKKEETGIGRGRKSPVINQTATGNFLYVVNENGEASQFELTEDGMTRKHNFNVFPDRTSDEEGFLVGKRLIADPVISDNSLYCLGTNAITRVDLNRQSSTPIAKRLEELDSDSGMVIYNKEVFVNTKKGVQVVSAYTLESSSKLYSEEERVISTPLLLGNSLFLVAIKDTAWHLHQAHLQGGIRKTWRLSNSPPENKFFKFPHFAYYNESLVLCTAGCEQQYLYRLLFH